MEAAMAVAGNIVQEQWLKIYTCTNCTNFFYKNRELYFEVQYILLFFTVKHVIIVKKKHFGAPGFSIWQNVLHILLIL